MTPLWPWVFARLPYCEDCLRQTLPTFFSGHFLPSLTGGLQPRRHGVKHLPPSIFFPLRVTWKSREPFFAIPPEARFSALPFCLRQPSVLPTPPTTFCYTPLYRPSRLEPRPADPSVSKNMVANNPLFSGPTFPQWWPGCSPPEIDPLRINSIGREPFYLTPPILPKRLTKFFPLGRIPS